MALDYRSVIKDTDASAAELRKLIPDTMASFGSLSRAAQTPGLLDGKTKELIALAISVATRCDACVAYHARGVFRAGAAREEVAEMLAVAIQMGGGPSVNYAAHALSAFDQFRGAAASAASA